MDICYEHSACLGRITTYMIFCGQEENFTSNVQYGIDTIDVSLFAIRVRK